MNTNFYAPNSHDYKFRKTGIENYLLSEIKLRPFCVGTRRNNNFLCTHP